MADNPVAENSMFESWKYADNIVMGIQAIESQAWSIGTANECVVRIDMRST